MYLIIYLFSTFSLFYIFITLIYNQKFSYSLINFEDFKSLKQINPVLIIIISINFLSLAGIPPLSGFLSKYYVFVNLIESNNIVLFFCLMFLSLIIVYYYIRPIRIFLFNKNLSLKFFNNLPFFGSLFVILNFYFNLILILESRLILFFIEIFILENFYLF